MYFHKTDKKNQPLNFHYFGKMNLPELYTTCTPERHWESILVNCEYLTREVLSGASKAAGAPIGTVFVVVDLSGFSLRQFWQVQTLARQCFQVSQDYFPETMGQLAIINAPTSFTYIWGIIKMWLSEETQAKINILGADYMPFLETLIEPESLPVALGGKCTSCPEGCESSNAGPWKEDPVKRRERRSKEVKQDAENTAAENTTSANTAPENVASPNTTPENTASPNITSENTASAITTPENTTPTPIEQDATPPPPVADTV